MKKIKVAHIITQLELGGAQINTIYTYENLDPERFDSYLISGDKGILNPFIQKKSNWLIAHKMRREIRPFKDLLALVEMYKILKKIKPDIIHTHSSKAGILGRLAGWLVRIPIIIHSVHGFPFSPFQSLLKQTFFQLSEKLASPLTTHLIFVSTGDIQNAIAKKLVKQNYSLIRSGFPIEKFLAKKRATKAIRQKYGIGPASFVCGILAPFKPQKGLFHLIEIAQLVLSKNPQVIFFIAGDGKLRKQIENKLKEKRIEKYFRLPGFVFDIENIIDLFDIGISTALWEGLPQSLVQFRLKKKPVVAYRIPGHIEIIKEGKNGFLIPVGHFSEFSKRIIDLSHDRKMGESMGRYVEDFSDWDAKKMVKKQEELYFSLWKTAGLSDP